MHTDKHLYLLLGADPEFLRLLTGLEPVGPYRFEALERRIDGPWRRSLSCLAN